MQFFYRLFTISTEPPSVLIKYKRAVTPNSYFFIWIDVSIQVNKILFRVTVHLHFIYNKNHINQITFKLMKLLRWRHSDKRTEKVDIECSSNLGK